MSTPDNELLEPFERLLGEISATTRLRDIERGGSVEPVWEPLLESGFLDALTATEHGGAGLDFAQIGALLQAAGRRLLPVPFGETLVARALLAGAGIAPPDRPIVLVTRSAENAWQRAVPLAKVAGYALIETDEQLFLRTLPQSSLRDVGIAASLAVDVHWPSTAEVASAPSPLPAGAFRSTTAAVHAAHIAGAADQVLKLTVAHAGQRVQFGKPIAQAQAIQQQLAVMAEHTVMARMAAQIGCSGGFPPSAATAAVAKLVCSSAVPQLTAIAHAVHGAIGISEEHDLQLFVRRLHEWRLADGPESYWALRLGTQYLQGNCSSSIDFAREMRQTGDTTC